MILTSTQIINLLSKYFSPDVSDATGIGNFRGHIHASINNKGIGNDEKDKLDRKVIIIDDTMYVRTTENTELNLGGIWNTYKINVDIYKLFSDCQGITSGSLAENKYYMFRSAVKGKGMSDDQESKSKDFIFPADYTSKYGKIKSDEDWKDFKNQQNYKDGEVKFTEHNPDSSGGGR